jgi:hypothetical protein
MQDSECFSDALGDFSEYRIVRTNAHFAFRFSEQETNAEIKKEIKAKQN